MDKKALTEKINTHLQMLCSEIGERRVGSGENRKATTYVKKVLEQSGWKTKSTEVTLKALNFIDNLTVKSVIADIGCRTSGETMVLA